MSIAADRTEPRPWWLSGLAAALATVILGAVALALTSEMFISEFEERPTQPLSTLPPQEWLRLIAFTGVFAVPMACAFTLCMWVIERRRVQPLTVWLGLGLLTPAPFTLVLLIVLQLPLLALILEGFGLLGAWIARYVRHGVLW